ncbi:MAG: hypothetical protein Q6367_007060 [Candidatus Freyarchaeota archaeon]
MILMDSTRFKLSLKIVAAASFLGSLLVVLANVWSRVLQEVRFYDGSSNTWYTFYKIVEVWSPNNFGIFLGDLWRLVDFIFTIMIREFDKMAGQIFLPPLAQLSSNFYENIWALEFFGELFTSKIWFYPYPLSLLLTSLQWEYLLWPSLWTIVLGDLATTTLWSLYYFLFPLLLFIALITGAVFVWKTKMKYLISSFICLQSTLALAALTQMVNIGLPSNTLFFSSTSFFIQILYGGVSGAAVSFLTSPLFFSALISYLYVEIGFQVIYMDEVTSPALERRKLIEEQLKVVEEIALAPEELATDGGKEAQKIPSTLSEEAIKFLRNIIEMKIFKKKKVEKEAVHDIRRLQAYVEKIYTEIPGARETLTAAAAAPAFGKVTRSAIVGTLLRVGGVILFSFICFAALLALKQFGAPLSVIESIEVSQPEVVLVLLLPIAFSFPMAAFIIGFVKEYGKKQTRKEEKQKEKKEKKK